MPDVKNGFTLEEQTAHLPLCATALTAIERLGSGQSLSLQLS
jgi:hypothetical protein